MTRQWMLDTSVAIPLRDGHEQLSTRIGRAHRLVISSMTLAELEGGVYRDPTQLDRKRERLEQMLKGVEVLSFDEEAARIYGTIVQQLGFSRPRIIDRMIAAQAIQSGATFVTLNGRDFRGIAGLDLEDWAQPGSEVRN